MNHNTSPLNDFAVPEKTPTEYLRSLLDGAVANGRHGVAARRPQAALGILTSSPAGPLIVAISADGIALIHFLSKQSDPANALAKLRRRFDPVVDQSAAAVAGRELERFMAGDETALRSKLDLSLVDSAFQRTVLRHLLQVRPGAILTYSSLAAWVDAPQAPRAVGGAMHDNPIPIYVPCHRVVRSDLSLGGYGGGLGLKRKLLELEGFSFTSSGTVSETGGVWGSRETRTYRLGNKNGEKCDRRNALLFRDAARAAREGMRCENLLSSRCER